MINFPATRIREIPATIKRIVTTDEGKIQIVLEGAVTNNEELRAGCAMKLYARHYGEWNDVRGGYRWQRLIDAARQCGLLIPMNLHRAAADAELTRLLLQHIAEG